MSYSGVLKKEKMDGYNPRSAVRMFSSPLY